MSRFRVLIADDEPLARMIVVGLLREDLEIEAVVECGDANQVWAAIAQHRADIAFLDVEMPEMNGIDIAGRLDAENPVVVFVTAFSEYAARAFDVRAVDYVLKPFSDGRFREALERAKVRVRERRMRDQAGGLPPPDDRGLHDLPADPGQSGYLHRIAFKDGNRSVVVKLSDVLWIEAQDYYARVHSRLGRHLIRATLASLQSRLDPQRFLRLHRNALVNVDEVRDIVGTDPLQVTLSDGTRVSVSRARRRQVEAVLRPNLRVKADTRS